MHTGLELASAIKEKKISAVEAVNECLKCIEKTDGQINAFISVQKESALKRAQEVQIQIDKGELPSPLAGVPIALKDNITTNGIETTCASKMLKGYRPVFDAAVVEKLVQAGMIVVGKLNMDEFGMGNTGETSVFGPVLNPWNISHVAGGSSGGSTAAVAAGQVPLSLGSDTGGSIRQPCAFCGVTGIKPTYGAVSGYGLIACASSLEQIGPVGKNINDCAALLSIISDAEYPKQKPASKIGLPRNYLNSITDGDIKLACEDAAKEFESAGLTIEEFDMPLLDCMLPAYNIISCAEISSNLARFDGLKFGHRSAQAKSLTDVYRFSRGEAFGLEVKKRILFGTLVLSSEFYDSYYRKALQVRSLVKEAYNRLFEKFDMILSPVAPAAVLLGENQGRHVEMPGDIINVSVNLAGLPAVSLPCGLNKQGLPVGFQLIGSAFSEEKLIAAAQIYQSRTDHHTKKPACGGVS